MDPLTIQNHLRSIEGVGRLQGSRELAMGTPAAGPQAPAGPSFKDTLNEYMTDVNTQVLDADVKSADLAAGRSNDVHGALIAMQKADLQLKLLVQVRNKVIGAYEDIMRMQA